MNATQLGQINTNNNLTKEKETLPKQLKIAKISKWSWDKNNDK